MILVVGLGNPGKKYAKTRHNIGFQVVDEFVEKNDFPDFKFSKKFNALISEGFFKEEKIIITKPQTFMNLSGKAVKSLVSCFMFHVSRIWVVHDDIDLPLGKIKISKDRGAAGHRGVESIIKELGTKDFIRFRVGIMNYELGIRDVEDFVLKEFNKKEKDIVKKVIKKTVEAIKTALKEGLEKTMSKYNV